MLGFSDISVIEGWVNNSWGGWKKEVPVDIQSNTNPYTGNCGITCDFFQPTYSLNPSPCNPGIFISFAGGKPTGPTPFDKLRMYIDRKSYDFFVENHQEITETIVLGDDTITLHLLVSKDGSTSPTSS